jgi:hypothetical protein
MGAKKGAFENTLLDLRGAIIHGKELDDSLVLKVRENIALLRTLYMFGLADFDRVV